MPSQDIVLGCYYLTKVKPNAKGKRRVYGVEEKPNGGGDLSQGSEELRVFRTADDVQLALEAGVVETLSEIRLRLSGGYLNVAPTATIRTCCTRRCRLSTTRS